MSDSNELTVNQLAIQAQAGSRDAFSELSRYFRPRLVALLESRYGNSNADAEDVAQEALAKAFVNIERFDPTYSFSTWLFTIAIRLSCDQRRSHVREQRQVEAWSEIARASQDQGNSTVSQVDPSWEGQDAGRIWSTAKEVLKPIQYQTLWMRYGEGRSVREIAQALGKTSIGVRVLLHRARNTLQRCWSEP